MSQQKQGNRSKYNNYIISTVVSKETYSLIPSLADGNKPILMTYLRIKELILSQSSFKSEEVAEFRLSQRKRDAKSMQSCVDQILSVES